MADMLVKLYGMEFRSREKELLSAGISIKKACIVDKQTILEFVKDCFPEEKAWVNECEYALFHDPVTCYIAVKSKQIVGFACYDATAKGFFGPIGVKEEVRNKGIGAELLVKSLLAMKVSGYAYAVIGWVAKGAMEFYQKQVHAVLIEDSPPNKSIYKNLISQE